MSLKGFAFRTIFGGKPWYQSMVGWATLVLSVSEVAMPIIVEFGLIDPEMSGALQIKLRALSGALAGLGIRRRLPSNGTIAAVMLALAMLPGCTTFELTVPGKDGASATIIKAQTAGRSCIVCEVDPSTGKTDCRLAQDASSDWIWGRIIPSVAGAVTAVVTGRGVAGGAAGPSEVGGCDSLFTSEPDTDPEKTEALILTPSSPGLWHYHDPDGSDLFPTEDPNSTMWSY